MLLAPAHSCADDRADKDNMTRAIVMVGDCGRLICEKVTENSQIEFIGGITEDIAHKRLFAATGIQHFLRIFRSCRTGRQTESGKRFTSGNGQMIGRNVSANNFRMSSTAGVQRGYIFIGWKVHSWRATKRRHKHKYNNSLRERWCICHSKYDHEVT